MSLELSRWLYGKTAPKKPGRWIKLVDKSWSAFSPLWTVSLRKLERGNDLIGNVPWVRVRWPQASGSGAGGRRNGLKIAVLEIFLLFKVDQIEPNLPG